MPSFCKTCGTTLPGPNSSGTCPSCLLKMGINEPTLTADLKQFNLPTPEELDRAIPRLEVLDLIAHGGMGAVFRARQRDLDRIVAVKVLPAELSNNERFVKRFGQEARTLASLNHPNIVTVHDSGIADGWCYIVMEYVDGVSLREAISTGKVSPQQALEIIPDLCEALRTAHQQSIVHRDIKPENILLTQDGTVKIADFGIAKLLDRNIEDDFNAGTRRYMAPEQLRGEETVDHRADIYSLGVVFYELLTGQIPGESFVPPSRAARVDRRIDEVVKKTLERRPELRYQDVREIAEELEQLRVKDLPPELVQLANYAKIAGRLHSGIEWSSRARVFGYPVIHIASGFNPETGKKRIARGLVAIGDVAIGGLAMGGVGMGVIGMGGCGLGLVGIGGLGVGLLQGVGGLGVGAVANGGGAIGGIASGGGALGGIAVGGGSLGYVALGGGAFGTYTVSGRGINPTGWLETGLGQFVENQLPSLLLALPIAVYLAVLIPILLFAWYHLTRSSRPDDSVPTANTTDKAPLGYLLGGVAGLFGAGVAMLVVGGQSMAILKQMFGMLVR